jgi:hypothetical protein
MRPRTPESKISFLERCSVLFLSSALLSAVLSFLERCSREVRRRSYLLFSSHRPLASLISFSEHRCLGCGGRRRRSAPAPARGTCRAWGAARPSPRLPRAVVAARPPPPAALVRPWRCCSVLWRWEVVRCCRPSATAATVEVRQRRRRWHNSVRRGIHDDDLCLGQLPAKEMPARAPGLTATTIPSSTTSHRRRGDDHHDDDADPAAAAG